MANAAPISDELRAAGTRLFEMPWAFVKGVVDLGGLPAEGRPEVAMAGRSNVGKSSLINALTRQSGLARTSNTPGRTQELNFFVPADGSLFLVDMPGYGFARAPKAKVEAWTALVRSYLRGRPLLRRAFVLVDARHGLKAPDREILAMLDAAAVAYQIVLTKADKVSVPALEAVGSATRAALERHPAAFPELIVTSSETGQGIDELRSTIAEVVTG